MKIIKNDIIPFKGFKSINICGFLFVHKSSKLNDIDINHEFIHSEQQKELLYIGFFIWYLIEWLLKLIITWDAHKAYRSISFEREAYVNEFNLDYIKTRKHYSFLKY